MMSSPGWMLRPNSCSFPASQTAEFSGLPRTASPRPVATASPLIRTVAATSPAPLAERHRIAQHHGLLLRVVRHRQRDLRGESPRVSMISSDGYTASIARRTVAIALRRQRRATRRHSSGSKPGLISSSRPNVWPDRLLSRMQPNTGSWKPNCCWIAGPSAPPSSRSGVRPRASPGDHAELDAIGFVERQAIEPRRREIFAACPRRPELSIAACSSNGIVPSLIGAVAHSCQAGAGVQAGSKYTAIIGRSPMRIAIIGQQDFGKATLEAFLTAATRSRRCSARRRRAAPIRCASRPRNAACRCTSSPD